MTTTKLDYSQITITQGEMYAKGASEEQEATDNDINYLITNIFVNGSSTTGFTFNDGDSTARGINGAADLGSGNTRFETVGSHGYSQYDVVSLGQTTSYGGTYLIFNVSDGTHFDVVKAYAGAIEGGAYAYRGDGLKVPSAGRYLVQWYAAVYSTLTTDTFDVGILNQGTAETTGSTSVGLPVANKLVNISGAGIVDVSLANDLIQLYFKRTSGTGSFYISDSGFILTRQS